MKRPSARRIRIGVSACLLGHEVRYDGGHRRNRFVAESLARIATLVPVCPEVEVGMGTPREPVRLVRVGGEVRMVGSRSGTDHTEVVRRWAEARVRALEAEDLCGFVLKKDSPSCGLERVEVHSRGGVSRSGRGLFAEMLRGRMPLLPMEEEGRLGDPRRRENFVERVFACRRLKDLLASRWRVGDLVRFHATQKFLLLAHDPAAYGSLGRLVAAAEGRPRAQVGRAYCQGTMRALARLATPARHAKVLRDMAASFEGLLPPEQREDLHRAIRDFRRGLVPLAVPLTLMGHHVRRHRVASLEGQTYLEPHPVELTPRNRA